MNEKQKIILITVAAIVLGMLLYPPFQRKGSEGRVFGAGYSWLFNPPGYATVDVATLVTQWLGVLIVGGIAYFLLKSK